MKAGWRTTEFWVIMLTLAIVGALLVIRTLKTGSYSGAWELLSMAIAGCGYSVSRGLAKRPSPPGASPSP
jgi:hypothetical protein